MLPRCQSFEIALCLSAWLALPVSGQENSAVSGGRVEWRTGAELVKQLRLTASIQSSEIELKQRLDKLAEVYRVAIFLDRRVDPNQLIEFSVSDVALEELLARLAHQVGAASTRLGSIVYIGPPRTAGILSTVAAERRKELTERGRSPGRAAAWSWLELSEPRQLLVDAARQGQWAIVNPELVPHDLWASADLPPLDLAERLTLLLAGFDLTFEVAGDGRLRLMPMPKDLAYEQVYFPADVAQAAATLKRDFPRLTARREGSRLIVRGGYDDHERIAPQLAGTPKTAAKTKGGETLYTLTVERKPAGSVVSTIAKRLGKQFRYDPALREKLSQNVSLTVKDVSLEELLQQTLGGLGLSYRVTEEAIEIVAKE